MAMDDDKEAKKTEVDTFETLQVKHSEMEKTIQSTEKQLKETIEALQAEKKLQQAEEGSYNTLFRNKRFASMKCSSEMLQNLLFAM